MYENVRLLSLETLIVKHNTVAFFRKIYLQLIKIQAKANNRRLNYV